MKRHISPKVLRICLHVWLTLLVIAFGAGCGVSPAPSTSLAPSAPASSAPGTAAAQQSLALTYAFPDDATSSSAAQALIKAYSASHPGIQLTPRPLPAKDYAQQLLGRLDSDPPDLFLSADGQAPMLIKGGAMLDINPLLTGDVKKMDAFQPAALVPWQRGTALYGLPIDVTPSVMFYNRDLFARNSVQEPAAGWTWDDWLADAKKLTVSSGGQVTQYGTAISLWSAMVWGNGGELISADGKRTLLDSPEAAAGVQFAADMVNVHHVAPPPQDAGGPDPVQLFKEQKVAMLSASSSLASSLLEANLPFKWAIAPLPTGKVAAVPLSVSGLAVSTRSQHAQAAVDFATWAIGPEGITARATVQPFIAPALRTAPAPPVQVPGAESIGQSVQFGRTLPAVEQWPKIAGIINESLVPVWQGKTTVAAAYAHVAPQVNALLASA